MSLYYQDETITLHHGKAVEVARKLETGSVDCIVTSPPYYGLRDYGTDGQIGAEETPDDYIASLVSTFRELRRLLTNDGTLWLNLGDSYARGFGGGSPGKKSASNAGSYRGRSSGKKPAGLNGKDLMGIPWRVALALQADGWILRSDIVWDKTNAMPESVTDRPTKAHEYVFLFAKSPKYHYDAQAVKEAGADGKPRNKRTVWSLPTQPFAGAHFATFPPALVEPCILAGCKPGGKVLDPFSGSGTTGMVARNLGRRYVGIDLNVDYLKLSLETRLQGQVLNLKEAS
jgi:site-specific DNA-methyltransferase (cytosine-N4-specific)